MGRFAKLVGLIVIGYMIANRDLNVIFALMEHKDLKIKYLDVIHVQLASSIKTLQLDARHVKLMRYAQ